MNGMNKWLLGSVALSALTIGLGGCDDKPPAGVTIAPTSSALAAPTKPASMAAVKLMIDKPSSKVDFLMDAPKEKIHGKAYASTSGDLSVDPEDITRSTGLVNIDISGLEIFQTVMDDKGKAADESKSDLQNKHARNWLEIGEDAPEAERRKNSVIQFSIKSIETTGEKSLMKLTGAERKMTFTAKGDFLLHQHKAEKSAELEATFKFEGDKPVSVMVKSVKPIAIDLAEFEVKPRDAFGKFAAKTLADLSPKVNKDAQVTLELSAKP